MKKLTFAVCLLFAMNLAAQDLGEGLGKALQGKPIKEPKKVYLEKIELLRFPEFKSDGSTWDKKYLGQSSNVRRPDLIYSISVAIDNHKAKTVYELPKDERDSNARSSNKHVFNCRLLLQKDANYSFNLSDYDTTSDPDYMGSIGFSIPTSYPKSAVFNYENLEIKIYFSYQY